MADPRKALFFACFLAGAGCGDDESFRSFGIDASQPDRALDAEPDAEPDAEAMDLCLGVDCSALDGPCVVGACQPDGSCATTPRPDGAMCNELLCTVDQTCAAGVCQGGEPADCSGLDDACIAGTCDPATGMCQPENVPNGTDCTDADPCTTSDRCDAGGCGGTAVMDLGVRPDGSDAFGGVSRPPLVISEIDPGDFIELYNRTSQPIPLMGDSYQLCSSPMYIDLAMLAPGVTVPANGYATIPWPMGFTDNDAGGEIILYSEADFTDSTNILDFVCWGTVPHASRLSEAAMLEKWTASDCGGALTAGSIQRIPNRIGDEPDDYSRSDPPSPADQCVP
ncbi:MAG: lamin tail domain-containing protein [Myxococcota bacterium]